MDLFDEHTRAFEDWLVQAGVTASGKITLADARHRSAGRAVLAKEDISADEELFSIPRSSILTVETSDLPADIKNKVSDPWLSLILVMFFEYQCGADSKWKAYFDVLPTAFDTLMYWTDQQLDILQGSAVVNKIGKETADETFNEQILPVVVEHVELFRASGMSNTDILEVCHRMGSIIMAYAFDLERTDTAQNEQDGWEEDSDDGGQILPKGMVPLADMLNADADRNNAKLFYEDDKVVMKTIVDVKQDEELFNDYGPLPSADVLRRYGYVTENYKQYDVVEVSIDMIKSEAKEQLNMQDSDIDARTSYLDEQGVLDDSYDISRSTSEDGQFPDELRALLNILALPQFEFEKMLAKEKLPKPELSQGAVTLLSSLLVRRTSQYTGALFAPGVVHTHEMNVRRQMAAHVINGEKEVLQQAIASVQQLQDQASKKRKADADNTKSTTAQSDKSKKLKAR